MKQLDHCGRILPNKGNGALKFLSGVRFFHLFQGSQLLFLSFKCNKPFASFTCFETSVELTLQWIEINVQSTWWCIGGQLAGLESKRDGFVYCHHHFWVQMLSTVLSGILLVRNARKDLFRKKTEGFKPRTARCWVQMQQPVPRRPPSIVLILLENKNSSGTGTF